MTAPTEAEIRAYMDSYPAHNWEVRVDDLREYADQTTMAFTALIDSDHVTDEDFHVFSRAHNEALRELAPAVSAALRPFVIEAQVRAAVRFFEHYPDAPLAKRPVPA